jgi:hypothetical protein
VLGLPLQRGALLKVLIDHDELKAGLACDDMHRGNAWVIC